MREGVGLIASNARFGPIPLRCGFLGSAGPVRCAQVSSGEEGRSECPNGALHV